MRRYLKSWGDFVLFWVSYRKIKEGVQTGDYLCKVFCDIPNNNLDIEHESIESRSS